MTDLAEVIGGALALSLLFDILLVLVGLIVGLVSLGLLMVQRRRGQRQLLHRRIPVWVRRSITPIPALVILGSGANPTWSRERWWHPTRPSCCSPSPARSRDDAAAGFARGGTMRWPGPAGAGAAVSRAPGRVTTLTTLLP